MKAPALTLVLTAAMFGSAPVDAYIEEYPPFSRQETSGIIGVLLPAVDADHARYSSGAVRVRLTKDSLLIRDGRRTVVDTRRHGLDTAAERPVPVEVYHVDIDGDADEDFIVHSWYGGTGLASLTYRVDMYLRQTDGRYARVQYETLQPDGRDYRDLDGDGVPEVLVTGTYFGKEHNYYTYHAYRVRGGRLHRAVGVTGLPKYVWMTTKPNDKDTTLLTPREREAHSRQVDASIRTAPPAGSAGLGRPTTVE
ncbi:MAG: hypothetical protein MOGMAGMI_00088 [Candidatus Omnitrophica bacterium]|nr:hypothetical protein [Candidatus Omnitrophota bacterium]